MGNAGSRVPSQDVGVLPGLPTRLHYYHAISRSLSRGSPGDPQNGVPRRAPLPTELVILILREAGATVLSHDLSRIFPRALSRSPKDVEARAKRLQVSICASADGPDVARHLLFISPAVEPSKLSRLAWLRAESFSKDQGWCSDPSSGSWSWIEVGIVRPSDHSDPPFDHGEAPLPYRPGNITPPPDPFEFERIISWTSHHNPIAGREFAWIKGAEFGPDHEIWSFMQPGDHIGVWLCAQFGGWQCVAKAAKITVHEWFEPTLL